MCSLLVAWAFVSAGCAANEADECTLTRRQAIVGGSAPTDGGLVGIARLELWAEPEVLGVCSGTAIRGGAILTAGHCVRDDGLDVRWSFDTNEHIELGRSCSPRPTTKRALEVAAHPNLDLALILDESLPKTAIRPGKFDPGDAYAIAGVGRDDTGKSGRLNSVAVSVKDVQAEWIDVTSRTDGGACDGDSGGPLLTERDGQWWIVGVLSAGAENCRGIDRYVRVDAALPWIDAQLGATEE